MAVLPIDSSIGDRISGQLMRASQWVKGGFASRTFAGEYSVDTVSLVDERLRPKAPMPKDDIEIMTRLNLSNMGLRNAQRVTAESHPELYSAWTTLCQRAGYGDKVPQLIMTESQMANAMEITDNEMVITTGLLKMLTMREVVAVLGHELGHGRHDHTGVRIAALGTFGAAGAAIGNYVGKMGGAESVLTPPGSGFLEMFGPLGRWVHKHFNTPSPGEAARGTSLLGYVAYIAMGLGIGQIAANQISVKPTELQADLDGVAISRDPEALASALTKMQAADTRNAVSRFMGYLQSGYPTVEERVANIQRAAREVPTDPVPAARGPIPQTQVSGQKHADRVEPLSAEAVLGNG